jgi:hypothetical protein
MVQALKYDEVIIVACLRRQMLGHNLACVWYRLIHITIAPWRTPAQIFARISRDLIDLTDVHLDVLLYFAEGSHGSFHASGFKTQLPSQLGLHGMTVNHVYHSLRR